MKNILAKIKNNKGVIIMKIKFQRIVLGVMATGLLVPLFVVASCNSSDGVVNYDITPKDAPQLLITDIVDDEYKKISTLEKVFDGINANNLQNLD
ncbi:MAG: hypothetical protein ACRCWU_01575, partial [Metamycoplasmataceae bacterium]